jgi:hypothetical protein
MNVEIGTEARAIPRKGIHKGDFRCSVSIFTPLFQFMSLGPAALSDNRPPAKSTPSLSNPNVVFSTPEDVVNKER